MHEASTHQSSHHKLRPLNINFRILLDRIFDPIIRDQSLARYRQKALHDQVLIGDRVLIIVEFHVGVAVDVRLELKLLDFLPLLIESLDARTQSLYENLLNHHPKPGLFFQLLILEFVTVLSDVFLNAFCFSSLVLSPLFGVVQDEFGEDELLVSDIDLLHRYVQNHYPDKPDLHFCPKNQSQADTLLMLELMHISE